MAVDRLTSAEAHPDVALEADVVARWELERVEAGQQTVRFRLVFPVAEDARFCCAAIFVRHNVLVLHAVLHRFGDAATCESSVNGCWLHFDLQSQIVANFGRVDLLAVVGNDPHGTGWRWTGIGDRSGRRQHLHVESERHVLLARLVNTLYTIRLRRVRHQRGMLLNDQHETGLTADVDQATGSEMHLEYLRALERIVGKVNRSPTLFVLAVALHVQHPGEVGIRQMDYNLHAVGLAGDLHFRLREVRTEFGYFIAILLWISGVSCNTIAVSLMVRCITEAIRSATFLIARVFTCPGLLVTVFRIRAVAVSVALRYGRADALASFCQAVSVIDRTNTATSLVNDHSSFQSTHASSSLVNLEAILFATQLTIFVYAQTVAWWAHTVTVGGADEASIRWT